MTSTIVQIMRKTITRRAWRACRKLTATVGVFVLMLQTALAGPVLLGDVVQRVNNLQGSVDLQLHDLSQQQDAKGNGSKSGTVSNGSQTEIPTSSILTTVNVETPNIGVDLVEDAVVEGTVCDCGEILLPVAGFPKWPLLFLAGIPLIFIGNDCDDCNRSCVTCDTVVIPTPSPSPRSITEVPEPASLLLFGTGLLALAGGLRRRYARKNGVDLDETEENNQ